MLRGVVLLAVMAALLAVFCPLLLVRFVARQQTRSHVFDPTGEFVRVAEDALLPPGLEIRIDMQSGERWARLPSAGSDGLVVARQEDESTGMSPGSDAESRAGAPAYSNISKKWRAMFAVVADRIEQTLQALERDETREDALAQLEDEAAALEIGAGILHSRQFVHLERLLGEDERALRVLAHCLQNNSPAVQRAAELELIRSALVPLVEKCESGESLERLLRIMNSLLLNGDDGESDGRIVMQLRDAVPLILACLKRFPETFFSKRGVAIVLRIVHATETPLAGELMRQLATHPDMAEQLQQHCSLFPTSKLCPVE